MAQFIIEIPDPQLPRVRAALILMLEEGEALDLENPTNAEIRDKAKSICIEHLKDVIREREEINNNESFIFEPTGIN